MARNAKIRIRAKDKALIRRLNKNANAKSRYYRNNYGVETDFETRGIKSFSTRKEFNAYVKSIEKYAKRSINVSTKLNNGYELTKKDYARLTRLEKQANRNRAKIFNKFKNTVMLAGGQKIPGNPTAGIGALFSRGDLESFKPLDFKRRNIHDEYGTQAVMRYYKTVADQYIFNTRLNQMKDNFRDTLIHGLLPNHGDDDNPIYHLDDDPRVKRIIDLIDDMTFDEWYEIYLSDTAFDFNFAYSEDDREKNITLLQNTLERFGYDVDDPLA